MSFIATRPALPAVELTEVVKVCRLLHDEKCLQGAQCTRRDNHAYECYGENVTKVLAYQKLVAEADAR